MSKKAAEHHKRLQSITKKLPSITSMPPDIMSPVIMKRLVTMPTQQRAITLMPNITVMKLLKLMLKSTAIISN